MSDCSLIKSVAQGAEAAGAGWVNANVVALWKAAGG
jgi:hypothetical protein